MTRPLLQGLTPERAILFDRGTPIAAATFCAAAIALSAKLPAARFAFNLCEGRAEFLLASAAAWLAGQALVLPPARLTSAVDMLARAYPDNYCLVDAPSATMAMPSFALRPQLDGAELQWPAASAWPPPELARSHLAAILFTSGSTGAPQPHAKSWGELCDGTRTLVRSLGEPPQGTAIVGTVPPQHMFGFETTVMLALQSGAALLDAHPTYPADLAQAIAAARASGAGEVWLMSTPLQLRAFHRRLRALPGVARIVTATMPLERDLALAVERDWGIPVDEIFGSTEGGILATRRPALTHLFSPAVGLAFSLSPGGAPQVSGGQLPEPLILTDRLLPEFPDFADGGRFEVTGRDADMVKIAGKRTSLQALNGVLLAVPQVEDGAFFLPEADAPRLAAVVVAAETARDAIRAALARSIDPAFLPRPLMLVPALPRDANGKLPVAELQRLLAPRHATDDAPSAQTFEAVTAVAADHPALPGHFPGHPIVPGVLLLELVEALLIDHGYRVRECPQAKFVAPVAPAAPLTVRVRVAGHRTANFSIDSAGHAVAVGKFLCEPMQVTA